MRRCKNTFLTNAEVWVHSFLANSRITRCSIHDPKFSGVKIWGCISYNWLGPRYELGCFVQSLGLKCIDDANMLLTSLTAFKDINFNQAQGQKRWAEFWVTETALIINLVTKSYLIHFFWWGMTAHTFLLSSIKNFLIAS